MSNLGLLLRRRVMDRYYSLVNECISLDSNRSTFIPYFINYYRNWGIQKQIEIITGGLR